MLGFQKGCGMFDGEPVYRKGSAYRSVFGSRDKGTTIHREPLVETIEYQRTLDAVGSDEFLRYRLVFLVFFLELIAWAIDIGPSSSSSRADICSLLE